MCARRIVEETGAAYLLYVVCSINERAIYAVCWVAGFVRIFHIRNACYYLFCSWGVLVCHTRDEGLGRNGACFGLKRQSGLCFPLRPCSCGGGEKKHSKVLLSARWRTALCLSAQPNYGVYVGRGAPVKH